MCCVCVYVYVCVSHEAGMADSQKKELSILDHTRSTPHTHTHIHAHCKPHRSAATMRILLHFLYTDEYSPAPDPRLVLAAANEYGLPRLQMLAAGACSVKSVA